MGYQEIRNSAANWHKIVELFDSGRARDISSEPKKELQPVILTGSGPSLDITIGKLKDWAGGIICHYSQAVTLRYYGVIPDYIMMLDSICNWEGLRAVDWEGTKTKIIVHPGMWPSLIDNWPGEMLFYRQNLGKPDAFGVNEQKIMYSHQIGGLQEALESRMAFDPFIKTEMTMFACTPPGQLFSAQILQYGPVYLTGMDFAYQGDQERFTNSEINESGQWVRYRHVLPEREYVKTANGLRTDPLHLYYKKNFISACRMSMQRVFTTDKGAITEMPYIGMDKVIKTQGKKAPDIPSDLRAKNYERYLAKIGCYALEFDHGQIFIEAEHPIDWRDDKGVMRAGDLRQFMTQKNRTYICKMCRNIVVSNDDTSHEGGECPACKHKALSNPDRCDIEKNMARLKSLVSFAGGK